MKLTVISDYGEVERVISHDADPDLVAKTIEGLDWSGFHQVVLERGADEWLEVGGSLDPTDGLSVAYAERGVEYVSREAPDSIERLVSVARSYARRSSDWRMLVRFE